MRVCLLHCSWIWLMLLLWSTLCWLWCLFLFPGCICLRAATDTKNISESIINVQQYLTSLYQWTHNESSTKETKQSVALLVAFWRWFELNVVHGDTNMLMSSMYKVYNIHSLLIFQTCFDVITFLQLPFFCPKFLFFIPCEAHCNSFKKCFQTWSLIVKMPTARKQR